MSFRMATTIIKELRLKIRRVVICIESINNLRLFTYESVCFTPYVANIVREILEAFVSTHWLYVPTLHNLAGE